nr:glutamate--tRNA ligase [Rickettsia endosymbiont of Ceutorhynchus assimilis]
MNKNIITRFAPSPTGFLHIGSARTALFNYLFARHNGGKFFLRIEDTDRERSTEEAVTAIFSGLKWLGLNWDGEVIFQSKRNELYKEAALKLLKEGKAYYCFTAQEEIERQRKLAIENKQHFIFDSPWRDSDPSTYPSDKKPVIRLKASREGSTTIHDTLQGEVVIENSHIDDMVLLRADGSATYMLAVVVDDHDMGITHIIRGDDHLTNAARQIAIYQALTWQIPSMTHIPLIHGADGAKLSKRHGALGVEAYKEMGYLPSALCNYLLRLGWGHGDDEIINLNQAIEWFDLEGLGKSPSKLDFVKMNNINAHYLRELDDDTLISMIIEILQQNHIVNLQEINYIKQALPSLTVRSETLIDLANLAKIYLVNTPINYSEEAKAIIKGCNRDLINQVITALEELEHFNKDSLQSKFKEIAKHNGLKLNELMQPVRALMAGMTASPGIFEMAEILGKENSLARLNVFDVIPV